MWLVSDLTELAAIRELQKGSDRALGIIAGAIIDSKLSDVLRRALGDDSPYSKRVRAELFHADGPLGSFGPRISMAYLIGLLTEQGHTDLQTFKKIRDLFAHYTEHGSFTMQRISALCNNFKLIDERVFEQVTLKRDTDEQKNGVDLDAAVIEDREVHMTLRKKDDDASDPKWRFVSSAKLFCATLDTYLKSPMILSVPLL